ncbi:MAG: hypothetical protein JEZ07_01275 [Phycisphaerae bacterium]|nr:hypothetical protein [Phycisphaerae bacterium]
MRKTALILAMIIMAAIFASCKKNEPKAGPISYDPAIDGINVRIATPMSPKTVELINRRGGAVKPSDMITDVNEVPAAPVAIPEDTGMGDGGMGMGNPGDPNS